jgi:hypothetical protein
MVMVGIGSAARWIVLVTTALWMLRKFITCKQRDTNENGLVCAGFELNNGGLVCALTHAPTAR